MKTLKKWSTKCQGKIIRHGQSGARIGKVGSAKWKSYCKRSAGIERMYASAKETCSPNKLSRKKWRCGSYGL